jgi:hypothetical protein
LAFWVGRCSLSLTALEQREKSVLRRKNKNKTAKQDWLFGLRIYRIK